MNITTCKRKYDELYSNSLNGNNFYKLIDIIGSEENIRLAYRNIKTNKGSNTAGVDNLTIKDIWHLNDTKIIHEVRKRLNNYQPQAVKRVLIPKEGSDKKRPWDSNNLGQISTTIYPPSIGTYL